MELFINGFIVLIVVAGVSIFFIYRTLASGTERAMSRLNEEISIANKKQLELSSKIKQADEELSRRQAEARELSNKMRSAAEAESKEERERIIGRAREEGEEIIQKANTAKEKIKQQLEKEAELKVVGRSIEILQLILNEKVRGKLDDVLLEDFLENLKQTDMSRIGPEITSAELITKNPLEETVKQRFIQAIRVKLNREIKINNSADASLGGGGILRFGSMALDGSLKNLIQETGRKMLQEVEEGVA